MGIMDQQSAASSSNKAHGGAGRAAKAYRAVQRDHLAGCGSRDQTPRRALLGHVHPRGRVALGAVRGPWGDPGRLLSGMASRPPRAILRDAFASF
jgi:hypothetical protein